MSALEEGWTHVFAQSFKLVEPPEEAVEDQERVLAGAVPPQELRYGRPVPLPLRLDDDRSIDPRSCGRDGGNGDVHDLRGGQELR
jgi:hypothetical protein